MNIVEEKFMTMMEHIRKPNWQKRRRKKRKVRVFFRVGAEKLYLRYSFFFSSHWHKFMRRSVVFSLRHRNDLNMSETFFFFRLQKSTSTFLWITYHFIETSTKQKYLLNHFSSEKWNVRTCFPFLCLILFRFDTFIPALVFDKR